MNEIRLPLHVENIFHYPAIEVDASGGWDEPHMINAQGELRLVDPTGLVFMREFFEGPSPGPRVDAFVSMTEALNSKGPAGAIICQTSQDPSRHCPSCTCGKRAPCQGTPGKLPHSRGTGSIAWAEHLDAYAKYSGRHGSDQSAERIAERGGFGYEEITTLLGHEPKTWVPR